MNRRFCILSFLALSLAAMSGCSSAPPPQAKKPLDKIQGKAQLLVESNGATDAALNAGGPSVYIVQGDRRYRLFLKTPVEITEGKEYVAEGIYAQKAIDEIGDPDQGKNGYPLESSCRHVVTTAWTNLSFDAIDANVSLVRARIKRYPARPLFVVTRIEAATSTEGAAGTTAAKKEAAPEEKNVTEITVDADKERASLIEGPTTQSAPLWAPAGGTVRCKVLINSDGKIAELETGVQLCEMVPWSQFRFQPPTKAGHPVKVHTEVEVRFDPRVSTP